MPTASRDAKFLSLFSGIGAFDLGLERAGMTCVGQCEIDPQASSVLGLHWPDVARFQDVRAVRAAVESGDESVRPIRRCDVLCGGFPCQDLSVAGRRAGLAGERSGLFWELHRIAAVLRPRWLLLENVPGLLSSDDGRDFARILFSLGELGYHVAYRVLDSQWFGVPQRRRRVFIVGCLDSGRAAEVLFERNSLPWDHPPRRPSRQRTAATLTRGSGVGSNDPGRRREDDVNLVAHTLRGEGFDASEDGTGRGTPVVAGTLAGHHHRNTDEAWTGRLVASHDVSPCLQEREGKGQDSDCTRPLVMAPLESAIATSGYQGDRVVGESDVHPCIPSQGANNGGGAGALTMTRSGVRRLTPVECERLQGLPDDWTRYGANGEEFADSPRYRMCGNAVTVNVAEWIGRRLMEARA